MQTAKSFCILSMEENVGIYWQYIIDILCIGGRQHDILWRKIEGEKIDKKSLIYRHQAINRRFNGKVSPYRRKSPIFWR